MLDMFFLGLGCHQDVVQIDECPGKSVEDLVHQSLKPLGRVLEPEGHADVFPQAKGGHDCRLLDVCLRDGDLVVPSYQVDLGEDGGP